MKSNIQKAFEAVCDLEIFGVLKLEGNIIDIDVTKSELLKREQYVWIKKAVSKYNLCAVIKPHTFGYKITLEEGIRRIKQNVSASIITGETVKVHKKVYEKFEIDSLVLRVRKEKSKSGQYHVCFADTSLMLMEAEYKVRDVVDRFKMQISSKENKQKMIKDFIVKDI